MARPPLPLGSYGKITSWQDGAGWLSRAKFRDFDGVVRMGRLLYRRSPVGVVARRPSGEQAVIKTGKGLVTIEGEPGEIVLHGFGRDAVRVDLRGEPADVAALEASSRGF
jgi:hypothetical protein